eukprot:evm.model.NODE_6271_length_19919_cov_71.801147.1
MRLLATLLLTLGANVPVEGHCSLRGGSAKQLRQHFWNTRDNKLFYSDQVFQLKGINWNGFESDCNVVHGLWLSPLKHYLDILQEQQFNALRIPLSFEIMETLDQVVKRDCSTSEPEILADMAVRQYLSVFLDHLNARGMSVLFDLHTIAGQITEFPWTDDVSEDRVVAAWVNFAEAFGKHPAVMGFEIKNEPHGSCSTDTFHHHCARVIRAIGERFEGLYFIDGTTQSLEDKPPWGGSFEMISNDCDEDPLCQLGMLDRIVFAPHVYGPD